MKKKYLLLYLSFALSLLVPAIIFYPSVGMADGNAAFAATCICAAFNNYFNNSGGCVLSPRTPCALSNGALVMRDAIVAGTNPANSSSGSTFASCNSPTPWTNTQILAAIYTYNAAKTAYDGSSGDQANQGRTVRNACSNAVIQVTAWPATGPATPPINGGGNGNDNTNNINGAPAGNAGGPLCDESGNGRPVGAAADPAQETPSYQPAYSSSVNFSKGLVPCGRKMTIPSTTNGAYQYYIGCTATASSCPALSDPDIRTNTIPGPLPQAIITMNNDRIAFTCPASKSFKKIMNATNPAAPCIADAPYAQSEAGTYIKIAIYPYTTTSLACRCELSHVFILGLNIYFFLLWKIALPLAGFLVVLGGLLILLASFYPKFYDMGKKMLIGAAIGLILVFGAWLIVNIVLHVIGYVNAGSWWNPL